MSLSPSASPNLARVVPIHNPRGVSWQGDLHRYLVSNPRHLNWLMDRPVIRHFIDEVLVAQMIHSRAEEVAIYHSAFRFEIDFRLEGRRHRIQVPNRRWALPILLRLKRLAGLDPTNMVAWQAGEIELPDGGQAAVWSYPTRCSERMVLRPRHGRVRISLGASMN
jgi:type II secretory ATPase GspE/PulE/Tfp pilus assembly ATPase PilB-like protein